MSTAYDLYSTLVYTELHSRPSWRTQYDSAPGCATNRRVLTHCLGYLDGVIYAKDWVAPPARLQQVTGNDVMRYFNFKVYGNPVWDPAEDPNLLSARSA